jgi:hypothetical protein
MSSDDQNNIIIPQKCPSPPKQQTIKITKKPSFVCLRQIDEDSGSGSSQQEHSSTSKKLSKSSEEQNRSNEDLNISNDRYEDSFDEKYGDECETFPESGNAKVIQTEQKDTLKEQ